MEINKKQKKGSFFNVDFMELKEYINGFTIIGTPENEAATYISFNGGCAVSIVDNKLRIEIDKLKEREFTMSKKEIKIKNYHSGE